MKGKKMSLKKSQRIIYRIILNIIMLAFIFASTLNVAFAKETEIQVEGKLYEFDEDSHYEFTSESSSLSTKTGTNALGKFFVSGDFQENGKQNEAFRYDIRNGNLSFYYKYDTSNFTTDETEWHLGKDTSKEINGISLDNKIMKGALAIQSSLDGVVWLEDVVMTDIFSEDGAIDEVVYKTNNIQQQNGCYYRIIIAYSLERKAGENEFLFVKTDDDEIKKVVEVYEIFIVDDEIENAISADTIPKKELGKKVNAGKDTGYIENNVIDLDDPHYGWDIGAFF